MAKGPVHTIAPLSPGSGIPVDALVVPPHTTCLQAKSRANPAAPRPREESNRTQRGHHSASHKERHEKFVRSVADLFAAYAIGRLMTAIPFTPGALGFTEASAVVILVF